jgi:hypothetical protein
MAAVVCAASLVSCSSTLRTRAGSSSPTTLPDATALTEPGTGASPQTPDPCALVVQAEAEAIVGVKLNAPVKAGGPDDRLCQYTSDPNGPTAQVEVFAGPGAKKSLDIDKDTLQHDFTKLAGVGDEAWLEADNVYVRKGSTWASVNVVALDADPAKVQQALSTIAQTIAGRLP